MLTANNKLTWEIYYASCPLHCPLLQGKLKHDGDVIGDMNILQSLISVALPLIKSLGIEIVLIDPPYIPDKVGAQKLRTKYKLGRV